MKLCSLASGSSGNCIYVGTDTTPLLIDVGISGKKVALGLEALSIDPKELQGILITHEHSDHISGLGVLARRYKCPIYGTKSTLQEALNTKNIGVIDINQLRFIETGIPFMIGDIQVCAYASSHDAIDPVFYTFVSNGKKISVATDLGNYNEDIQMALSGSHALFVEANHDVRMLEVGPYPYFLKQRILSDLGHLSNVLSGQLICELSHEHLRHVMLGHLSHENNMPEIAYETVKYEMSKWHQDLSYIQVHVAHRSKNSTIINL